VCWKIDWRRNVESNLSKIELETITNEIVSQVLHEHRVSNSGPHKKNNNFHILQLQILQIIRFEDNPR